MYNISKWFFKLTGWTYTGGLPAGCKKAIMIAAPHTSNWDIIYARAAFFLMGIPVRFTIKKEWMKGPIGPIVRLFGGLAIDRNPKGVKKISMTQAMVNLFKSHDELVILITPEGTRGYAPEWRTGFYYAAQGADVPILLGYLDYAKKEAGVGPAVIPDGNIDQQVQEIKNFYRTKTGKFPEQGVK